MELVHGTMEAGPNTNAVFTLMRRFLVYMVTHGSHGLPCKRLSARRVVSGLHGYP